MSIFEEVCLLSCENWVASFPEEIPKHKFSKKHNQKMKKLFSGEVNENKPKLSKTTLKIILIAAVLLAISTTAFAIPTVRKFITEKFLNYSEYNIIDKSGAQNVISLTLNYIPEGFEKTEEFYSSDLCSVEYKKGNKFFCVEKNSLNMGVYFDTENHKSENIIINGFDAVYYKSNEDVIGIIFNNGNYTFVFSGNISKEEFVKIAQNTE